MRAVTMHNGQLEHVDVPDPVPGPGEVLVKSIAYGICVSDHARGQGIGTKLLNAIKAQAHTRNLSQVRLDVINTNPHARALYERQGFTPGEIQHLGPLRHLFGFKSATTMIWQTP